MDADLAETLNAIECARALARVRRNPEPCIRALNGGYLIFAGALTRHTCAVGIGCSGALGQSEFETMIRFFADHRALARVHASSRDIPFADQLSRVGFALKETPAVLTADAGSISAGAYGGIRVREANGGDEREQWIRVVAAGWACSDRMDEANLEPAAVIAAIAGVRLFLALSLEGDPVGGGAMAHHAGVCILFGDSTLPTARGRGVQSALIRERAAHAARIATVCSALAAPGSGSERNYLRAGFESRICGTYSRGLPMTPGFPHFANAICNIGQVPVPVAVNILFARTAEIFPRQLLRIQAHEVCSVLTKRLY